MNSPQYLTGLREEEIKHTVYNLIDNRFFRFATTQVIIQVKTTGIISQGHPKGTVSKKGILGFDYFMYLVHYFFVTQPAFVG